MAKQFSVGLPCSPGDTIYRIKDDKILDLEFDYAKVQIERTEVSYMIYAKSKEDTICCSSTFFNDTWFIDKKKAEAKLKQELTVKEVKLKNGRN